MIYIKKILIIIISIIVISSIIEETINNKERRISILQEHGYSKEEESKIISTLSEDQIELVLDNKYSKNILLNLMSQKYFINKNLDRYVSYYTVDVTRNFSDIVKDVNSNIDFEFYNDQVPSDISKKTLMIANKHYSLSPDFIGFDLVNVDRKYAYYPKDYQLNKEAYEHFKKMWEDAKKEGLDFGIYSAYRSYDTQNNLYAGYVSKDGKTLADTYSARPGNSEHQTGLAVDLKSRTKNTDYFETTKEYDWLINNSYKYGFIMRYELGQEYITGYQFEPWHYRYCGLECAKYIHDNNITFEEYYEYFIK